MPWACRSTTRPARSGRPSRRHCARSHAARHARAVLTLASAHDKFFDVAARGWAARAAGRAVVGCTGRAGAVRRPHAGVRAGTGRRAGPGVAAHAFLLLLPRTRLVRGRQPARPAGHRAGAGRGPGGLHGGAGQLGGHACAGHAAARHAHRPCQLGAGAGGPGLRRRHGGVGLVHQRALVPAGRGLGRLAVRAAGRGAGLCAGLHHMEPAVQPGRGRRARGLAAGAPGLWRRAGAAAGRAGLAGRLAVARLRARAGQGGGRAGWRAAAARAVAGALAGPLELLGGWPGRGPDRRADHRAHAPAGRDDHAGQQCPRSGPGPGLDPRAARRAGRFRRLRHLARQPVADAACAAAGRPGGRCLHRRAGQCAVQAALAERARCPARPGGWRAAGLGRDDGAGLQHRHAAVGHDGRGVVGLGVRRGDVGGGVGRAARATRQAAGGLKVCRLPPAAPWSPARCPGRPAPAPPRCAIPGWSRAGTRPTAAHRTRGS